LPSTFLPVRLDQRFAIDPRLPSLRRLAARSVTSLEPRTLHQPGKLQKLSKNDYVFTPSISAVNQNRAIVSILFFNGVQAVHKRVPDFGAYGCSVVTTRASYSWN
jgi:hypothetical protein